MADNTTLNTGTGGDTIATDDIGGVKHQLVKVEYGVADSATPVSTTNPLPVDQTNTTVADGGALPAKGVQVGGTDGSVFQVLSTDNAGRLNANINGAVPVTDNAGSLTVDAPVGTPVFVRLSDGSSAIATLPVSGPLTDAQLRASAVPVDTELPAAAALADAASNPTAPATGSFGMLWNGTTWDRAKGDATNGAFVNIKAMIALPAGTNAIGKLAANSGVDIGDVDVTSLPGSLAGVADDAAFTVGTTPVLPVGFLADQTATDSVNEGDTGAARMTLDRIQIVTQAPSADTAGLTTYHLVSAATTNAAVVKASAGKLHRWYIYNSNAAARKLAFHNSASSPTAGASIFFTMVIPPTSAANDADEIGIAFSSGIAITTVTGLADSDNTAVAANDLIINLWYV